MEILKFIIGNWDNILLVAATFAILTWFIAKRRWDLLQEILFGLVTTAEREYGGATGALKKAKVIEWLYPHIPAAIRYFITEEKLEEMVDKALEAAKTKWHTNPELIEPQFPFPEELEEAIAEAEQETD